MMETDQDIGRVFDELVEGYTTMMETMVPHYRRLISGMLELLPTGLSPTSILDLGCGNGNVAAMCARVCPEAQLTLVDASEEMIKICRGRFAEIQIAYVNEFFQNLSFQPDSFDLALAGFSFHHLEADDKQQMFDMLHQWLQPGGVFACADLLIDKTDPEHGELVAGWRTFVLSNEHSDDDWDWLADHYAKYDRPNAFNDQKEWLLKAGFQTVRLSWNDHHWGCFHAIN